MLQNKNRKYVIFLRFAIVRRLQTCSSFFNSLVNQFLQLIFFLILYRDTCIGDASIDIGIDLMPLQSIGID